jgi:hypothetical protein
MRMIKINGKLVSTTFIEIAEFEAESKTLTLLINGSQHVFTGDDTAAAWAELQGLTK